MINLNRDERKMDTNEIGSWRKLERVYNCSQEVCNNLTKEKNCNKKESVPITVYRHESFKTTENYLKNYFMIVN